MKLSEQIFKKCGSLISLNNLMNKASTSTVNTNNSLFSTEQSTFLPKSSSILPVNTTTSTFISENKESNNINDINSIANDNSNIPVILSVKNVKKYSNPNLDIDNIWFLNDNSSVFNSPESIHRIPSEDLIYHWMLLNYKNFKTLMSKKGTDRCDLINNEIKNRNDIYKLGCFKEHDYTIDTVIDMAKSIKSLQSLSIDGYSSEDISVLLNQLGGPLSNIKDLTIYSKHFSLENSISLANLLKSECNLKLSSLILGNMPLLKDECFKAIMDSLIDNKILSKLTISDCVLNDNDINELINLLNMNTSISSLSLFNTSVNLKYLEKLFKIWSNSEILKDFSFFDDKLLAKDLLYILNIINNLSFSFPKSLELISNFRCIDISKNIEKKLFKAYSILYEKDGLISIRTNYKFHLNSEYAKIIKEKAKKHRLKNLVKV